MKLNKKKELYVNAIIGGKKLPENNREKMIKAGLMEEEFNGYNCNAYTWIREALTAEPLRDLKLLYTVLNDSQAANKPKVKTVEHTVGEKLTWVNG
jgi:hypothetical protein